MKKKEQKDTFKEDMEYMDWLKIVNCFDFLRMQGLITEILANEMFEKMLQFKPMEKE